MASHGARQMPVGPGPDDPDLSVCYVFDSIGANLRSGGALLDHRIRPQPHWMGGVEDQLELHPLLDRKVGGLGARANLVDDRWRW